MTTLTVNKDLTLAVRILLSLLILVTVLLRVRMLPVPLERDEGEYAYMAQLLLQGIPPYEGAYSMKFPGMYFLYALVLQLFGESNIAIHSALLVMNCISIVLMYFLGKALRGVWVGIIAAIAFAAFTLNFKVEGYWANSEHFLLPFILAGTLVLRSAIGNRRTTLLFFSGLFYGIALIVKQQAMFFALFAIAWLIYCCINEKSTGKLIFFSVGFFIPLVITSVYILVYGVFQKFFFWTFIYAKEYASQTALIDAQLYFLSTFQPLLQSSLPLWILAGIGIAAPIFVKHVAQQTLFVATFFLASALTLLPGLIFRPHYFVLVLPAVALLVGFGAEVLFKIFSMIKYRSLRIGIPLSVITISLVSTMFGHYDMLFYRSSSFVTRATFGINPFVESIPLAKFIRERTHAVDKIAVFGSEPQILFYAQRRSATRYIYTYPLMEHHPYALAMQEEMIAETESSSPKILVFVNVRPSWLWEATSERKIFDWFEDYSGRYYNLLARLEVSGQEGPAVILIGDAAVQNAPRTLYWISVFERKDHSNQ